MERRVQRYAVVVYGVVAYLAFLASMGYAIGFVGGVVVPKTVGGGTTTAVGTAVVVNLGLLALFGLQHSLMARPSVKRLLTRVVPEAAERSTFVLSSAVALGVLYWGWQPLDGVVWSVTQPVAAAVLWGVFAIGWLVALVATFQIDHATFFGLAQVLAEARGEDPPQLPFQTPGLYRYVRHPMMTGLLVGFWVTPRMTVGHLLFAAGATGYIVLGVWLEERALVDAFGAEYERYREDVPMVLPYRGRRR
jgi:protein-S-isoprenylcysteine O-methyltransferase Ste14